MATPLNLYLGVEGGATWTKGVLVNERGECVARADTGGTNKWQVGLDVTIARILELVDKLLEKAEAKGQKLCAAGLCLSGCDSPQCVVQLTEALYAARADLLVDDRKASFYNDSRAALESASAVGGVVLIAGTGSNCSLVERTGKSYNCGGWGHAIGDEGSGLWIAKKAVKYVIQHDDGMDKPSESVEYIRKIMHQYFNVNDNLGMLDHLYTKFIKAQFAGFTKLLADGANVGDPLCNRLFQEAGTELAKHVIGVTTKSDPSLFPQELIVVCMGSVWKSWNLLSEAFSNTLKSTQDQYKKVRLVKLREDGTFGAAVIGAREAGFNIPIDYPSLTETICCLE